MTYTLAGMEVPKFVHACVRQLLLDANYHHAVDDETGRLDMHGIALQPGDGPDQLDEMRAAKDGAYLERNQVVAALACCFPAGVGRTAIEGWDPEWHNVVYIDLPTGQVSWHFHDDHAPLFAGLPKYAGTWDGHDTPEKYRRVAALQTFCGPTLGQRPDGRVLLACEAYMAELGDALKDVDIDHEAMRVAMRRALDAVMPDVLTARAQGRAEALALILSREAEEGLDEFTDSYPIADTGDYGTSWNVEKLAAFLCASDSVWSLVQEAEGEFWHQAGLREEAERTYARACALPTTQVLSDLASHEYRIEAIHQRHLGERCRCRTCVDGRLRRVLCPPFGALRYLIDSRQPPFQVAVFDREARSTYEIDLEKGTVKLVSTELEPGTGWKQIEVGGCAPPIVAGDFGVEVGATQHGADVERD